MGYVDFTLSVAGGGINAGQIVGTGAWAGFDHAALVTAYRSRTDAKDLWLWYSGVGYFPVVAVSGANTSACKVTFNAQASIASGNTDANHYRIYFGDLSRQVQGAESSGGAPAGTATITASAATALTLPSPGRPMQIIDDHDVDELTYPEHLVTAQAKRNEFSGTDYRLTYDNISGEDYYELRAFIRAQCGGAGTFTTVFTGTRVLRIVPGTARFSQESASQRHAELEIEEMAA